MKSKLKRIAFVYNNEKSFRYGIKLMKEILVHNYHPLHMLEWMYTKRDLSPVVIDRSIPW